MTKSAKHLIAALLLLIAGAVALTAASPRKVANPSAPNLLLVEAAPVAGTFFSMQLDLPPFPFNPMPTLDLFSFDTEPGTYYFDDTAVDYEALTFEPQSFSFDSSGGSMSLLAEPPPPGGGGGGDTNSVPPPSYIAPAGLKFTNVTANPNLLSLSSISVNLREHEPWEAYDIYFRTNLVGTNRWKRILEGVPGQTNFTMPVFATATGFYILGASLDEDGDGLPSAWEHFVSRSNPLDYDSDNDGKSDGEEDSDNNGRADYLDYLMETRAAVYTSKTNAVEGSTVNYGEFTFLLPLVATTNTPVFFHVGSGMEQNDGFTLKTEAGVVVSNRVTFAPGTWFQRIRVTAPENDVQEDRPRSVSVTLTNFPGGRFDEGIAVVTISDNGDKPALTIFAVDDEAAEPSVVGGVTNTATFRLFREGIVTNSLAVNYTLGGTATNGTHYWTLPTTATFPAGSNWIDLVVRPRTNAVFQDFRTVVATLTSNANYRIITNHASATATIFDDDQPTVQLLAVDDLMRDNGSDTAKFAVIRSGVLSKPLSVNLRYGGTAKTSDYQAPPTVVLLPANSNRVEITVTPTWNSLRETNKATMRFLSVGVAGGPDYGIGTTNHLRLWLDDTNAPLYTLTSLKQASAYHSGVDSPAIIEIIRTGSSRHATNFAFEIYSNNVLKPTQYLRVWGDVSGSTVVFPSNSAKAYIYATAWATGKTNGGGQITVPAITGAGGPIVHFLPARQHVVLSVVRAAGLEGTATTVQYRATRTATGIGLNFEAIKGGTATEGDDYTPESTFFNFGVNDTQKTIDLTALNDGLSEGQETVVFDANRITSQIAIDLPLPGQLAFIRDNVADLSRLPDTDTDGDGLGDRWEFDNGFDPLVWDDSTVDADQDGLSLRDEAQAGTDPSLADSDGDGIDDYHETSGMAELDDDYVTLRLRVGDTGKTATGANCAFCHTTDLRVGPWALATPPRPGALGAMAERAFSFRKGSNYPIALLEFVQNLPRPNSASGTVTTTAKYTAQILPEDDTTPAQFTVTDPDNRLGSNKVRSASFPAHGQNPVATLTVPKIEVLFTNLAGNTPLDTNPNWGGGLRVFPDQLTPTDAANRNQIKVIVKTTPPLNGKQVRLRVLDVDDPSPDEDNGSGFPLLDWNDYYGKLGNDNRGSGLALASTLLTLNASGVAETTLTLPMQPGDNFRVAALLEGTNALAYLNALQVLEETNALYVGSANRVKGFAGTVSPMATVWRKLHLEFDSMEAPPTTANHPERNRLDGFVDSVVPNSPSNGWSQIRIRVPLPNSNDPLDKREVTFWFERGKFKTTGLPYLPTQQISRNTFGGITNAIFRIAVPAILSPGIEGQSCSIWDDDDQYLQADELYQSALNLPSPPLPAESRAGGIVTNISPVYSRAYILPVDANAKGWNTQPRIPFQLHLGPDDSTVMTASQLQLLGKDRDAFWAFSVVLAYQHLPGEDGDPNKERPTFGELVKFDSQADVALLRYLKPRGWCCIYLENIRDESFLSYLDQSAIFTTSAEPADEYLGWLYGTIAHELGHAPGWQTGIGDHAEGSLMKAGGLRIPKSVSLAQSYFTPKTVLRFRSTSSWTGK